MLYLQGFDGLAYVLGWTGGYCLVAVLLALDATEEDRAEARAAVLALLSTAEAWAVGGLVAVLLGRLALEHHAQQRKHCQHDDDGNDDPDDGAVVHEHPQSR